MLSITLTMSAIFLGEKVGWRRWTAILIGFGVNNVVDRLGLRYIPIVPRRKPRVDVTRLSQPERLRRAIEALAVQPAAALVDGNYRFKLPCDVRTVVGGDGLSLSIAAASILAKTARDRLMIELDGVYPGYGFANHKGYNAPVHQAALKAMGPCPAHRRSWSPIRALLEEG